MIRIDKLSYIFDILTNDPNTQGIDIDKYGWARVDELIEGLNQTFVIDYQMLRKLVNTDCSKRFSFNEDKTLIRANYGHTFPLRKEVKEKTPPPFLYYGTGTDFFPPCEGDDIYPQSGIFVHLYDKVLAAVCLGVTMGEPVVYRVNSGKMAEDGFIFYYSEDELWMTEKVPAEYYEAIR